MTLEREALYWRIDERVERMLADGWVEESRDLAARGYRLGERALACPGYRELGQYLEGEIALSEAAQRTKFKTHRLARRQYTWFKAEDERIHWLEAGRVDLAERAMEGIGGWL